MGQVLLPQNVPLLVRASATTVTLESTYLGQPTRINVGGQQYRVTDQLILNMTLASLGGLDTGAVAANTLYYIYAGVSSGSIGLVASLAAPTTGPAGFANRFTLLGKLRTNVGSSDISTVATSAVFQPQESGVKPWVSTTVAFTNDATPTGRVFYTRRVGSSLEVYGNLRWSAATAGVAFMTVPFGLNALSEGYQDSGQPAGVWQTVLGGAFFGTIYVDTATTLRFLSSGSSYTPDGTQDYITVDVSIPIAEWVDLFT